MIISDRYRYLFVELPHTASTAISSELCELYAGRKILSKHARYHEFLRVADERQKNYFIFSGIRNPLDEVVTIYCRYRTNHLGRYTDSKKWECNGGSVSARSLEMFEFASRNGVDFPAFLKHFYRKPYANWASLAHRKFDFVIRFERLQQDFEKALAELGIDQIRPLPVVNKTSRRQSFESYYSDDVIDHAIRVFGPFMKEWGYAFPAHWKQRRIPWTSRLWFQILKPPRNLYWRWESFGN